MRLFGVLLVSTFLAACGEQAQEPAVQEPTAQEPVAQKQSADVILAAVDTSDWEFELSAQPLYVIAAARRHIVGELS